MLVSKDLRKDASGLSVTSKITGGGRCVKDITDAPKGIFCISMQQVVDMLLSYAYAITMESRRASRNASAG